MKTNVRTRGNFLLSRDAPQTDRQADKRQNQIIQKPSRERHFTISKKKKKILKSEKTLKIF